MDMAYRLTTSSSMHSTAASDNYSAASENCLLPATPNHSLGLAVLASASSVRNRVLIGEDATKDPSEVCLVWVLKNLVKPGDLVTVVGILHHISTPMGYKSQANLSDFVGTNRFALEAEMSQKLARFEDKFGHLAELCDSQGVYLDITITAGTPMKSVLVREAVKLKATHVILDRNLRRDRRYYKEQLECNVVTFSSKNQAEYIRESSSSYMLETSELPPRLRSPSSTTPSSPVSTATSSTFNLSSNSTFDISTHRESRASTQTLMSISEDSSCVGTCRVDSVDDRKFEDLCGFLPESESYRRSMSSSASDSRENSYIDLLMLTSPDGVVPVWSCTNKNEVASASGHLTCQMNPNATSVRSSPGHKTGYANSAPSSCFSSPSRMQQNAIPIQPVSLSPKLGDFIKSHKYETILHTDLHRNTKGITDKLEESNLSAVQEVREAIKWEELISDVADAVANVRPPPQKLITQTNKRNSAWGKTLTQAPPLCSVCKLTSLELGSSSKVYEWLELRAATNDFGTENLIAEGEFSFVYRGILPEGQVVAVKKLKLSSLHGDAQFGTELEALSCAQHRNVVRLLGYGVTDGDCALVYEYVCNGSLDQHISGNNGDVLDWPSRYKIAIGAARGLRYLHEECRVGCIVHRDMRANNILLTHDYVPLVGDFGLAKPHAIVNGTVNSQVLGAQGFLAPEYVESFQETPKMDVYSFGVVLLELIIGQLAIDFRRPEGEVSLIEWARRKVEEHRFHELVDDKVGVAVDVFELSRMAKTACACIEKDPQSRPGMSQIVRMLEGEFCELSPEGLQGMNPINIASTSADRNANDSEEFHPARPSDCSKVPHGTSKRASAAPGSWRSWVRT